MNDLEGFGEIRAQLQIALHELDSAWAERMIELLEFAREAPTFVEEVLPYVASHVGHVMYLAPKLLDALPSDSEARTARLQEISKFGEGWYLTLPYLYDPKLLGVQRMCDHSEVRRRAILESIEWASWSAESLDAVVHLALLLFLEPETRSVSLRLQRRIDGFWQRVSSLLPGLLRTSISSEAALAVLQKIKASAHTDTALFASGVHHHAGRVREWTRAWFEDAQAEAPPSIWDGSPVSDVLKHALLTFGCSVRERPYPVSYVDAQESEVREQTGLWIVLNMSWPRGLYVHTPTRTICSFSLSPMRVGSSSRPFSWFASEGRDGQTSLGLELYDNDDPVVGSFGESGEPTGALDPSLLRFLTTVVRLPKEEPGPDSWQRHVRRQMPAPKP